MADERPDLKRLIEELSDGVSSMLARQEEFSARMDALDARLRLLEEERADAAPPSEEAGGGGAYDYRVLLNERTYAIEDARGERARMESVRRCVALRRLERIRTRYHTGSGARETDYAYRVLSEDAEGAGGAPDWTPLRRRVEEEAGADYSVSLPLPAPIRRGEAFELRHRSSLRGAFTARNEWVTLVVEYPTEAFRLEVNLPAGRKVAGARREESQGASNGFNKRRVHPRAAGEAGGTRLEWEERRPVTGRAYTLFWDW